MGIEAPLQICYTTYVPQTPEIIIDRTKCFISILLRLSWVVCHKREGDEYEIQQPICKKMG